MDQMEVQGMASKVKAIPRAAGISHTPNPLVW